MTDTPGSELDDTQLVRYLERLGVDRREATADLAGLRRLHLAHLDRIPFENLDIVFADGVDHDQRVAVEKIITSEHGTGRGGWCFELNGAFALLLSSLGFTVRLLGAAVLLVGPNQVIEHLVLDVEAPGMGPQLVDVGFGDSFDLPLTLNVAGAQDGGSGEFVLIPSPEGTTVARLVDGVPHALFRFKRVVHAFDDFAATARSMQVDPAKKWATHPFATRRLDDGAAGGRVTLSHDHLEIRRGGQTEKRPVTAEAWPTELATWFSMTVPAPRVQQR